MEKRHIKRLTTDDPQNNVENMFNLAFVKDSRVWMRCCGDDNKDCTLLAFVGQICKKCNCNVIPETEDVAEFSGSMIDCAFDLCPVANAYFGLVQAAELRERLKQYEDCNLTPDEIQDLMVANGEKAERLSKYEKAFSVERAQELAEADEDMRLMVMPDLPQDMGDPMEPLKIEAAARSVLMKIDYWKEKDPNKLSSLDYTLYACCYHALEQKRDELLAKEGKADVQH